MHVDDEDRTWRHDGACTDLHPDIFYPDGLTKPKVSPGMRDAIDLARAICKTCPVFEACHRWALSHELEGIWAGTTPGERHRMRQALGITVQPILIDSVYDLTPPDDDPPDDDEDDDRELDLSELEYDEDLQP